MVNRGFQSRAANHAACDMEKQTFVLRTENRVDALRRVAGIFSRNGCNIETVNARPEGNASVMEITVFLSGEKARELKKALNRLYDVISVDVKAK